MTDIVLQNSVSLPVESGGDGLLHGGLPVVTAVGGDVDGALVGDHLGALLPGGLDVEYYLLFLYIVLYDLVKIATLLLFYNGNKSKNLMLLFFL